MNNISDEELDRLVLEKMQKQKDPRNMSDEELDQLVMQKIAQGQLPQAQVKENIEAELGALTRAKYALEPLESNRRALLAEQFGGENVLVGPDKELYLKQYGEIRPVNKKGLSTADFADFLGATPEVAGAGIGALAGMGAGSIPAAIAGGVAGSGVRQGLSAILGTPQVAEGGERAVELGLSGIFSGAGAGLGKLAKGGIQKGAKVISNLLPDYQVSKEGLRLAEVAAKENIPKPTVGQMAGGRDLDLEKIVAVKPLAGRSIRSNVDNQVKAIKKNIESIVGDITESESQRYPIGLKIKESANQLYSGVKQTASNLFNEVADEGADIAINAKGFKGSLLKELQKGGFFDMSGNPIKYTSRSGMTPDQFKRVQNIFGQVLGDIDQSATDMLEGTIRKGAKGADLTFKTIDTMRKTLDANISEAKRLGFDDLVIKKLRDKYMDISENMLREKSPETLAKFKTARQLWAKTFDMDDKLAKIANVSDEKVISNMMSSVDKLKEYKELVGDAQVKEAVTSHLNDIFSSKIGKEGQVGALGLIKSLKDKREIIEQAVGKEAYQRLQDNLFFLDKIGAPVNPSRTAITEMMFNLDPRELLKSFGQVGTLKARANARNINRKLVDMSYRSPELAAKLANIIGSPIQREGAYGSRRSK